MNIFERFFHSDDVLRLKFHSCENGNYSTILQEVHFFLLHFHLHFLKFFKELFISNYSTHQYLSNGTKFIMIETFLKKLQPKQKRVHTYREQTLKSALIQKIFEISL